jgi:glycosyltransferase involved in cell wall biosynthesis
VIVHSRYAAGRLQGARWDLPVRVIPHLLSPAVARYDGLTRAEVRARLGLPVAGPPLLLMLGHVTPPKQADLVLEALAILHAGRASVAGAAASQPPCLVIGGAEEPGLDLDAALARHGLPAGTVRRTGWLEEEAFFTWLRAADLLLALRFPVAGETSGTLVRALGMGTPALVYDFGPAAEFPDSVVAKLPFRPEGNGAADALASALAGLLADPARLAAQSRFAREHLYCNATAYSCAAAFAAAIQAWQTP